MTKFMLSLAVMVISFAVGLVTFSLTRNLNWAMLIATVVFVSYIGFAIYRWKKAKTIKVK